MISPAELDRIVGLYPVLGQLSPSLREAVRLDLISVNAPVGHLLFDLDSACSLFLLPASGAVRVVKPAVSGREILLYRVLPGDSCVLTVSCLLGHATYPARGIVEHEISGVALSQALFNRLVGESSAFRTFVFRYFAGRVAELMELVEEVAFGPMDQRLANYLVERGPVVRATHQLIADEIGTVREVVSRRLKQLEAGGLVRLERGQVVVVDAVRLQRMAGSLRDSSH
ncbi:MAG: Crp/Fnr family transcriptional regulator [Anaerolineales bacterium]|nr:Crp/Fnr family transcriptional regulator [Anaerolineales bacterium]